MRKIIAKGRYFLKISVKCLHYWHLYTTVTTTKLGNSYLQFTTKWENYNHRKIVLVTSRWQLLSVLNQKHAIDAHRNVYLRLNLQNNFFKRCHSKFFTPAVRFQWHTNDLPSRPASTILKLNQSKSLGTLRMLLCFLKEKF